MNDQEFQKWIRDTKNIKASPAVHEHIDALHRQKYVRLLKHAALVPAFLVIIFVVLLNVYTPFYVYALDTPIGEIVNALRFVDSGYQKALDKNKYQKIDKQLLIDGQRVSFDYLIVDGRSISILSNSDAFVFEKLQVTIKGQSEVQYAAGSYFGDYKVYTYYFAHSIADESEIMITASDTNAAIAIIADLDRSMPHHLLPIRQTVYSYDSKLTIDMLSFGSMATEVDIIAEPREGISLQSIKARLITDNNEKVEANLVSGTENSEEKVIQFPVGQLSVSSIKAIEIYQVVWITDGAKQVTYDRDTQQFHNLPRALSIADVKDEADSITFRFSYVRDPDNDIRNPLQFKNVDSNSFNSIIENDYVMSATVSAEERIITFINNLGDISDREIHMIQLEE